MKIISNKRILQHIAFWAFYVVIYTINYTFAPNVKNRTIGETFVFLPGHMFFTYFQMYWLVPNFLLTKKYFSYFLFSIMILVIALTYSRWAGSYFLNWNQQYAGSWFLHYVVGYGRAAFSYLPVAALAVSIKLYKGVLRERDRALIAETERVKMELDMLRSQLHPHFLFNTLNNLYSLTLTSSAAASTVVLHLSDLLRYILYECADATVPLEKELSMLKKYVELEKLRYGNRLDVAFTVTGETKDLWIAPLLLLPFIENSFKHSTSEHIEQCWINMHVHVAADKFTFQVINSRIDKIPGEQLAGGIGLQNVRKRLALLYPEKHDLKITEEEELFSLKLQIALDSMQPEKKLVHPDVFNAEILTV
jgi:hypothetical protein